jgi:hypothetical protein
MEKGKMHHTLTFFYHFHSQMMDTHCLTEQTASKIVNLLRQLLLASKDLENRLLAR